MLFTNPPSSCNTKLDLFRGSFSFFIHLTKNMEYNLRFPGINCCKEVMFSFLEHSKSLGSGLIGAYTELFSKYNCLKML